MSWEAWAVLIFAAWGGGSILFSLALARILGHLKRLERGEGDRSL